MQMKGKRHLLIQQAENEGLNLIGLQETRIQNTAVLPDSRYIMLHAAANSAGHFGCALWLSKHIPYAVHEDHSYHFDERHCTVVALSCRHLLVNLEAPHLKCLILVAHAPSAPQDPDGIVAAFWRDRTEEIRKVPGRLPLLVLADANSRLGCQESPAIGPEGAETETVAGSRFHDFLLLHCLFLPATMSDLHTGPSWTWCSALGDYHRLDYVAIPQAWSGFRLHSSTWPELEVMQKRQDHIPVRLSCLFGLRAGDGASPGATFKRKACRPNDLDPSLDQGLFLERLRRQAMPAWDTDVDSHFAQLVSEWREAGQAVASSTAAPPRQSFLTEATLQLVEVRKGIRLYLKQEEKS